MVTLIDKKEKKLFFWYLGEFNEKELIKINANPNSSCFLIYYEKIEF